MSKYIIQIMLVLLCAQPVLATDGPADAGFERVQRAVFKEMAAGNIQLATGLADASAKLNPSPRTLMLLAEVRAMAGDPYASLLAVDKAVQLGYSDIDYIKGNKYFNAVVKLPEWNMVMEKHAGLLNAGKRKGLRFPLLTVPALVLAAVLTFLSVFGPVWMVWTARKPLASRLRRIRERNGVLGVAGAVVTGFFFILFFLSAVGTGKPWMATGAIINGCWLTVFWENGNVVKLKNDDYSYLRGGLPSAMLMVGVALLTAVFMRNPVLAMLYGVTGWWIGEKLRTVYLKDYELNAETAE